jgi:hypothetical protein
VKEHLLSHLREGGHVAAQALQAYCYAKTDLVMWCVASFMAGGVTAGLIAWVIAIVRRKTAANQ